MTRDRENRRRRPLEWLGDIVETALDVLLWWL